MSEKHCDLTEKKCVPCEGGVPQLTAEAAAKLNRQLNDWQLEPKRIGKDFRFKNFVTALDFVNRVGAVAESEGHHPDIFLHEYNRVRISLWTHAVGGLTENDFIVAAKIDRLPSAG